MPGPLVRSTHDTEAPGLRARKKDWYQAVLAGNLTLDDTYPNNLRLDPDGSHRDITLPAVATSEGITYVIVNYAGGAENLVVKNVGGDTIVTVNQNDEAVIYCDGSSWILIRVATVAQS